jgi:hypothetical protein
MSYNCWKDQLNQKGRGKDITLVAKLHAGYSFFKENSTENIFFNDQM